MKPFIWTAWNGELRPAKQTVVPIAEPHLNELLSKIAKQNGNTFAGCWDVFAWKDDAVIFAEGKNRGKDRILDTQRRWLDAALTAGLKEESFLIVEWSPR